MLYDAFLFLNELEILEMRLHILSPHVDRFILVEANQTHSTLNTKGGFIFEKNRDAFQPFLDRIIYVKLDREFFTVEDLKRRSWFTRLHYYIQKNELASQNDTFQRNCILRGLTDACTDDTVLISDLDEIINPAALPAALDLLKRHPVVAFEQTQHRYFLNNREKDFIWTPPRITTCGYTRQMTPHAVRAMKKVPVVKNGGWHFTGMGSMDNFIYKMESFMHHDRCYKGKYKDIDELKKIFTDRVIKQRIDIYDFMDSQYEFVEIDETYPVYIRDNRERYRHLIYHPEE